LTWRPLPIAWFGISSIGSLYHLLYAISHQRGPDIGWARRLVAPRKQRSQPHGLVSLQARAQLKNELSKAQHDGQSDQKNANYDQNDYLHRLTLISRLIKGLFYAGVPQTSSAGALSL
jgi:hypothetical protein